MGNNTVPGFHRLRGRLPFTSTLLLGTDATINMNPTSSHRFEDETYGGYAEDANVLYTVEGPKCSLGLRRIVCNDGNVKTISLTILDTIIRQKPLWLPINKNDTGLLCVHVGFTQFIAWNTRKNVDARGGVTDTKVYLYGTANRCGLLVLECKNDSHEREAKAVTIAHYFVSSNGSVAVNRSSETTDIGFSVVTKVGISDGKFDITMEGPVPHPIFALLHKFDELNRSGIWKPSMCPHCCNIQREHCRMFAQSDSEGDVVPLRPRLGSQRTAATIANDGRFRVHANGSYI